MPNKPEIITFGCRLNTYESAVMQSHATEAGLDDAIIFNTCAVTAEAERQARQAIRKARRENPHKKIIVTGCAAQINPGKFEAMEEVSHVLGNHEKMQQESFQALTQEAPKMLVNDIMSVKETAHHLIAGFDEKTRAYIQVQNGCDHRCTFCTIPYGRGNSRSVPIGEIVRQVKTFVENGFKEVVLTGVDITSYGHDLPATPTLGQMMKRLLTLVPDLPRLRLSSVDPVEIDDEVFDLLAHEPRFMPHLHISLQAGDDLILKRMKRRHLRPDILKFCDRARACREDVVFGADIIAGFPTETEERFLNTFNILKESPIAYAHIFPYSPRPGTPAARMPQVEKGAIKERAKRMREEAARVQKDIFQGFLGKTVEILMEKENMGRTPHFIPVLVAGSYPQETFLTVRLTAIEGDKMTGELV